MKKIFGYFFIIIINYLLISFFVFTFSYVSLINNKTYDLIWIKYIQKKLYFSGLRNLWNTDQKCSKFDKNLLYAPVTGECIFSNPEFSTKLNFDENRRLNLIADNIDDNEKVIAALGDSLTMGWGVNNDETYSFNLQKLVEKKVLNLGVASYGTIREIKRLKLNKFYNQIETIIIQYHLNDIYENESLDINKTYSKEEYNKYFLSNKNNLNIVIYLLKNYKKSLRLLFSHLNDLFFEKDIKEEYNLTVHLNNLEKIINQNLKDDDKRVIVFLINEPHQKLIYEKKKKFNNFEFFTINIKQEHLFVIDDHLNKKGHKFVGKKLFDYLSMQ
jgi:hypothetical protein